MPISPEPFHERRPGHHFAGSPPRSPEQRGIPRPGSITPTRSSRPRRSSTPTHSPLRRRGALKVLDEARAAECTAAQLAELYPEFRRHPTARVREHERPRTESEVLPGADSKLPLSPRNCVQQSDAPGFWYVAMLSPHDPWHQSLGWHHSELGLHHPLYPHDDDGKPRPDSPVVRATCREFQLQRLTEIRVQQSLMLQAALGNQDLRKSDPFDLEGAEELARRFNRRRSETPTSSHRSSISRSPSPPHAGHSHPSSFRRRVSNGDSPTLGHPEYSASDSTDVSDAVMGFTSPRRVYLPKRRQVRISLKGFGSHKDLPYNLVCYRTESGIARQVYASIEAN